MSEFINEFGKENFIILISIVGAIVLALIIIVVIEKIQMKTKIRKQMRQEISNINYMNNVNSVNNVSRSENESKVNYDYVPENVETLEEPVRVDDTFSNYDDSTVYYVEDNNPELVAKEKLEEVTKRLIDEESSLIDHTHFETEQEEKSIISYEELVNASHDIDEKNDKLLADEDEAAITLEELYQKHVDEQNVIYDSKPEVEVKVNNPIFEDDEPKKFRNSEVISPVFGFYSGEVKQDYQNNERDIFEEMNRTTSANDLEDEIQKTEDFLSELKRLKNKLD